MATQEMQMPQIAGRARPPCRRTPVILAVAAALMVGAVIGRETAGTSKTETVAQPASAISFVGTDSADAARRAQVFEALGAIDTSITLVGANSADAARRALVYRLCRDSTSRPVRPRRG